MGVTPHGSKFWNTSCVGTPSLETQAVWAPHLLKHKLCGHPISWNTSCVGTTSIETQAVWAPHLLKHKLCGHPISWNTSCVGTPSLEKHQHHRECSKARREAWIFHTMKRLERLDLSTLVFRRGREIWYRYLSTFMSTIKTHYRHLLSQEIAQVGSMVSSSIHIQAAVAQWLRASNIYLQIWKSTSEWRGFESRWFYQSGFKFGKTPLLILNQ